MFHLLTSLYNDLTTRPRFNVLFVGFEGSGKSSLLADFKERYVDQPQQGAAANKDGTVAQSQSPTLPKTRPTVGQNVLDVVAPSINIHTSKQIKDEQPYLPLEQVWPRPLSSRPSSPPISTAAPQSGWFSRRTSSANSVVPDHGSSSMRRTPSSRSPASTKSLLHFWDLGGELSLRSMWREYYGEADCVVYFWDVEKGGQGEGRQEAWQGLVQLVEEEQLEGLPLLIVLSRADRAGQVGMSARRGSKDVGAMQLPVTNGVQVDRIEEEGNGQGSEVASHEEAIAATNGDANPARKEDAAQPDDAEAPQQPGQPEHDDTSNQNKPTAILQPTAKGDAATQATVDTIESARDALESLRVFITSQTEAYVEERASKLAEETKAAVAAAAAAASSRSSTSDTAKAEDSEGPKDQSHKSTAQEDKGPESGRSEGQSQAELSFSKGPPIFFPTTHLCSLSLLGGRGADDVMQWLIEESVRDSGAGGKSV